MKEKDIKLILKILGVSYLALGVWHLFSMSRVSVLYSEFGVAVPITSYLSLIVIISLGILQIVVSFLKVSQKLLKVILFIGIIFIPLIYFLGQLNMIWNLYNFTTNF